jgi:hypothetical protein
MLKCPTKIVWVFYSFIIIANLFFLDSVSSKLTVAKRVRFSSGGRHARRSTSSCSSPPSAIHPEVYSPPDHIRQMDSSLLPVSPFPVRAYVGNGTGNPRVSQRNPYPYPWLRVRVLAGKGTGKLLLDPLPSYIPIFPRLTSGGQGIRGR